MPFKNDELLNKILDKALSLPVQDRDKYLAEACLNNEELRNRIDQLISGCEVDVPKSFLRPSKTSAEWIKKAYRKLKANRGPSDTEGMQGESGRK